MALVAKAAQEAMIIPEVLVVVAVGAAAEVQSHSMQEEVEEVESSGLYLPGYFRTGFVVLLPVT